MKLCCLMEKNSASFVEKYRKTDIIYLDVMFFQLIYLSNAFTRETILSTVNPNSSIILPPGADAPK